VPAAASFLLGASSLLNAALMVDRLNDNAALSVEEKPKNNQATTKQQRVRPSGSYFTSTS
jgi:hypothetical protein